MIMMMLAGIEVLHDVYVVGEVHGRHAAFAYLALDLVAPGESGGEPGTSVMAG
jgi:hypothetical protein